MKKINLIEWLSRNSHEKQSPQRFARYAAMLLLLLTCVTHAWATDWYLSGPTAFGGYDWGTQSSLKMSSSGISNWVYKSLQPGGEWAGFKVTDGSTWYGKNSGNVEVGTEYTPSSNGSADPNYCDFSQYASMPYYFFFNTSTKKLMIQPNYYLAGSCGATDHSWATDKNTNTYDATNGYFKWNTMSLTAETEYKFKLTNGQGTAWTYTFHDWSGVTATNGTKNTTDGSNNICFEPDHDGVAVITFKPTDNTMVIHCPYQVSYNKGANGTGSNTTASKTWNSSLTLAGVTFTRDGYTQDGWSTSDGGDKVYNLGGSYTANADVTLYPHWSENKSTVTLVSSPANKGTFTVGGSTVTSTQAGVATTPSVTAVPIDGYHFVSWSITGGATVSSTTTNPTTVTGGGAGAAATLTATFAADDVYSLTVAAGTGISSVSGSTNDIKAGNNIAISATVATGYTWSTWTKTAGSGTLSTFTAGTKNQTVTVGTAGDITLTASATENMSSLTTSNHYDAGDPEYFVPSKSVSSIGISTTADLVAATPSTGYRFAGWTLSNNIVVTSGDEDTDLSITVRTTGNGAAATAQANYEEVLSQSTWVLKGGTNVTGDNWSSEHALAKKTGHSTESIVYYTASISSTNAGDDDSNAYSFKIVKKGDPDTWYGLGDKNCGGGEWWYSRSTGEKTMNTGNKNIQIIADVAGDYEIKVDYSTPASPKVTVTFPTSYTLTYSLGTVPGTSGSISSSPTTASGSKVLSGSTVTLTAPSEKTGYSWKGWYPNADGSGVQQCSTKAYAVTMNADKILYACYTEDMHDVTVTAGDHGHITAPASPATTVSAGISTGATITAVVDDYGYFFQEWTVESGSATFANSRNASTTVNATSDATVQANFVSHWTIAGGNSTSKDGADAMGDWDEYRNGIDNWTQNAQSEYIGYVDIDLPANTLFYFKVRDLNNTNWYGNTGEMTYTNHTNWVMSKDESKECRITTAGKGTYRFTWNENQKKLTVTYPTSYTVTYNVSSFYNEDNGHDYNNTTGGTISYAKDNDSITVATGKYVVSGGKMVFKATPATGFTFAGWYSNKECTTAYTNGSGGAKIAGDSLVLTIGAAKTVYAKFTEIMTTVEINYTKIDDFYGETCGWVKVGGATKEPDSKIKVGVHTTVTLRMEADSTSHYYSSVSYWTHDDIEKTDSVGADYHCDLTLRGKGAGDNYQSIYVSFPQLEKIYFKNWNDETKSALWDSVYVGFNPNEDGLGENVWGKSNDDVRAMKRDGEDNYNYVRGKYDYYSMWWSYVPRHMTRTGNKNVVFFNKGVMRTYEHFAHGKAAYRKDYNKKNNMFVPASTKKETLNTDCDYYSNGYWRNFWVSANEKQGYYLQKKTGTNTYEELGEFLATKGTTYTNEYLTEMEYTVRFDNTNAADFRIVSAGGEHYVANANLTSGAPSSYLKSDNADDHSFRVTPTAEGNYVFKIVQSSDTMDISVDYPVAIGDYVLENVYNDGSERTARSNVIKASVAETPTRYSMYLSNAGGSATLKLRRCTDINGSGDAVWDEGTTTNLGAVLTAVGTTPGVYQFDLTVNTSNHQVSSVDSVRLYTGNYYIKVDAAPGGWAGYTRNVMDKNSLGFDRTKSYTFDNYWCKYYGTGTAHTANIKCVVANDYCNQLSDTLKQDALSIAWMSGGEPYVPNDGTSIRFSYNSATNTINRAYLKAQDYDDYLDIKVSTDDKVYNTSDEDLYGASANKCRFTDTEDWVYEKTVKVIPGGKAGVVANYASITQTFLPDTTTLIGSPDASSTKYTIRLVYDFKTNYMMSSFMIDDETTINENLSDFDMLWVRHKDESATQLTLGTGKKLTNVRPIGAIEFRYDSVCNDASHSGTGWVDMHSWTSQNRPFLKYFVSFPFDVEMNSIFGLNQASYGLYYDYVIQKYNGAKRAKDGLFFGDDNNYWENVEMGDTLKANEGYCVIFDNEYVSGLRGQMWEHKTTRSKVYLYFPALKEVATITNSNTETTVPAHTCTIDRSYTVSGKTKNHMITDSHWNLIGNPLFHDAYIKKFTNGEELQKDSTLKSYYYMDLTSTWASQDWKTETVTTGSTQLKAMSSVLVQWCGTINWGTSSGALAAPRRTNDEKDYLAQLEIWYNGNKADQTFVKLSEEADTAFVLREDMCKVLTTARPNIYTFAGDYDVAYNEMPIESCTVPVGVLARRTGTYTFSMPKNFSGTVTLIDKFDGTRTNLAMEDYEVYLNKGTIDDRFELEINISKMPTAIDGAEDGSGSLKDGKAHKFIMNGVMYILENGRIYDAQGNRVK